MATPAEIQAGSNTVSTLNGFFKEQYAKEIKNLIPDGVKLLKKINFASREEQTGNLK